MISTIHKANQMVVTIARLLASSRNVFHGLASPVPAVAIALARELHNPDLEYLNITGGVNVRGHIPTISTCSPAFWKGSESFFSLTDIFDLCARGELDTAFLSGVQIDRLGRLNNSVIGEFSHPKVKLPGGAGSAAIVPQAKRTIVWRTRHDPRIFVEACDFVTAAGNVREVVSPLALFVREEGELRLSATAPGVTVETVQENTGFPVRTASADTTELSPPTREELRMLQNIDPDMIRVSEFT